MNQPHLEFVMPGIFDAIPLIIIYIVLPIWLIVLVFKYSSFSILIKALLVPVCIIAPFVISLFWPLAIKFSGIIGFTGQGEYEAPYLWYATELFGELSEYVWAFITIIAVYIIHASVKPKIKLKEKE